MPTAELTSGEVLYRIGVNTNCPVHQIFAGGQCFPRRSQKVTGYGAETKRVDLRGAIVIMQEGQPKKCIESAKHKVIRMTKGRKSHARVHDTRNPKYRKMKRDVPVIDYMYLEPVDTLMNPYKPVAKKTIADMLREESSPSKPQAREPLASESEQKPQKRQYRRRNTGGSDKE